VVGHGWWVAAAGRSGGAGVTAHDAGAEAVVAWIERTLGGRVTRVERLPRWRAGWLIDLQRGKELVELYARGERVSGFLAPFPLDHEVRVHALLEDQGVPVPHVHGIVDDGAVRALVMDRVRGVQGLALAAEEDRPRLLLECIDHLACIHAIPMDAVAAHGIEVPARSDDVVLSRVFRDVEAAYLAQVDPPDAVIEVLRHWVRRNRPHRARPSFVTWDAAQFLHHGGTLTALIDFELAHVGDAAMDLATLRTRDSIEPFGDLAPAFARYAELTGGPVDFDVVRYYEVSQLTVTMMLQAPVLRSVDLGADHVTHLTWYVESGRYACDVLRELLGTEAPVDEPTVDRSAPSRHAPAFDQLVASLRAVAANESRESLVRYGIAPSGEATAGSGATAEAAVGDGVPDFDAWRRRCDYRLARYLRRVHDDGAAVDDRDRDDTGAVLGRTFDDLAAADAALVDAARAGTLDDRAAVGLVERRLRRLHALLGPPGSLVVRHPPLQRLPG
jgi:aminoglycoside phosphotransferase (APT) family kinase protein